MAIAASGGHFFCADFYEPPSYYMVGQQGGDALSGAEQSLVLRSQSGDEAAYGQLMQLHERRLYSVMVRLLGNSEDARDGCQEVFWRAWQSLATFDAARAFGPWLMRITTNYAYDVLRRRQRQGQPAHDDSVLEHVADEAPGPEAAVLHLEQAGSVGEAIRNLAPEYRLVIGMRHDQGLSYQEIAEQLGWPLSLVKNRLMRARRQLRDELSTTLTHGGESGVSS